MTLGPEAKHSRALKSYGSSQGPVCCIAATFLPSFLLSSYYNSANLQHGYLVKALKLQAFVYTCRTHIK